MNTEWKEVARFENKAPIETHNCVVLDRTLYIVDGDKLLAWYFPRETLWEIIGKFLGLTK